MEQLFETQLGVFFLAALGVIIGAAALIVRGVLRRNPQIMEVVERAAYVADVALTAVIGIARNTNLITFSEWAKYTQEAEARELDVRLIAAFYEVEAVLEAAGIEVDERTLLLVIERAYLEAKKYYLEE